MPQVNGFIMANKLLDVFSLTALEDGVGELHIAGGPGVFWRATFTEANPTASSIGTFTASPSQILDLTTDVDNNVVVTIAHSRETKQAILPNMTVETVAKMINRS